MATNYLVLEDGTVLEGEAFGFEKVNFGEVVFNTAMGGYQECLTDPTNCGQILISTYPLIGDYGITDDAYMSNNVWISGLVVKEYCKDPSPMYNGRKLDDFLKEHQIPAIAGIDTRELTIRIRKNGTLRGAIVFDKSEIDSVMTELKKVSDENLVAKVSCESAYSIDNGKNLTVGVIDCGLKNDIKDSLSARYNLKVFPYDTPAQVIMDAGVNGVVIANGPGNPAHPAIIDTVVKTVKDLSTQTAIMGLCFGSQVVALALGGKTYKLKYGHRGTSQPVRCGNRIYITTQNHGYAVDDASLEGTGLIADQININDKSVEGTRHKDLPIITCQYTPGESSDTAFVYEDFTKMMEARK
ncbi:MAG: glutamine-hydrolyzing carbamoyl-phosphate synthase small subunit [Thermoplasmata archaeon]|nr:glutamine-hydrolyzing carbamoyl-phosphate synthase small subunit [Thermoplasmata archaeon]